MRSPEQPLIVDSSVIIKWFLEEELAPAAERLRKEEIPLLAPDLALIEICNILWKRVRLVSAPEQLTLEAAQAIVASFPTMPVLIRDSRPLLPAALEIACQAGRSFYDSLYLALAVAENAVFITADEKLVNALQSTPFEPFVEWLGQSSAV